MYRSHDSGGKNDRDVLLQARLEHTESDTEDSTSEKKSSWWNNLPFWREEQSAVDAAEAEVKREALLGLPGT